MTRIFVALFRVMAVAEPILFFRWLSLSKPYFCLRQAQAALFQFEAL